MRRLIQLDVALLLAVLLAVTMAYMGPRNAIDTYQFDLALAQNHLLRPASETAPEERAAVIAIDERSLDKLQDFARVLLAPTWAEVIEGLAKAEVKAIGFDIVFAYPDKHLAKGWEQSFLGALNRHRKRVVLGRSERVVPAMRFQAAFGFADPDESFGAIEVHADPDNVHRAVQSHIALRGEGSGERKLPTLSNLLLAKAGESGMPDVVRLAPKRPFQSLPTYSLWDVRQCARDDPVALRRAFKDKIVVIGTTLAGEDRRLGSDRFMSADRSKRTASSAGAGNCTLDRHDFTTRASQLVPSVYFHAAAVDAVQRGEVLRIASRWAPAGIAAVLAFAIVWTGFRLSPWRTFALLAATGLVLHAATSLALEFDLWLPTASLWVGLAVASLIAYLVRYLLVERRERLVRSAFNHYLTEELVDRIVASDTLPSTGGERRDVTVMFADLSGFTALSERVTPEALMDVTNDYLATIVNQVQDAGGYVDKFIGDAVMAIWGAPAEDDDHALSAARAAIDIIAEVRRKRERDEADGAPAYDVKIALNSGAAVVGNVGANNRLNYSAVGRTVNIAARIEGLLSTYQTRILFGEDTATRIGERMALRHVGEAQLKGIKDAIKLFAPADMAPAAADGPPGEREASG